MAATFGQGGGPIVLSNIQCVGTEERLISCTAAGTLASYCTHARDAGVRCHVQTGMNTCRLICHRL